MGMRQNRRSVIRLAAASNATKSPESSEAPQHFASSKLSCFGATARFHVSACYGSEELFTHDSCGYHAGSFIGEIGQVESTSHGQPVGRKRWPIDTNRR
jgi:hypothetical protein